MKLVPNMMAPEVIVDADSYFDMFLSFNQFLKPEEVAKSVYINIAQDVKNSFGGKFYMTISPKKTFRNRIFPEYKIKRAERSKEKSEALHAFMSMYEDKTVWHEDFEADDIVVYFMHRGSKVLAIDKDIKGVATREVFDYKQKKIQKPKTIIEAEEFTVYQSMMGDSTDGIPGAKDIGKAKALRKILDGIDIFEWVQLYDSIEQAELMMQLVRMDQIDEEIKLKLWRVEDWKLTQ